MTTFDNDRQIAWWLLLCAAVIFGMILLGGVTRLTHSGLSMVEWKPLVGIIPPLSEQAWLETFEKYKQFPEYQKINRGMSLEGFKYIFMYEYLHRVLGRLIGVLYFLPFMYFLLKGRVKTGLSPKLWILFVGGGLQGLLGWYMVKSGLVNDPHVSQYRLTAHLGVAVALYGYMIWVALDLLKASPEADTRARHLATFGLSLVGLVYLMILTGGLVAGTRAGFAYATWPLMGDSLIPAGLYNTSPAWLAAFEDITTIQFNHRMFAYLLVVLIGVFVVRLTKSDTGGRANWSNWCLVGALIVQVTLGISTLLLHVAVPVAAAHQAGAVVLFTATILTAHALHRQSAQGLLS